MVYNARSSSMVKSAATSPNIPIRCSPSCCEPGATTTSILLPIPATRPTSSSTSPRSTSSRCLPDYQSTKFSLHPLPPSSSPRPSPHLMTDPPLPSSSSSSSSVPEYADNPLSNSLAFLSRTFVPSWCNTPIHWTASLTDYLFTDCPCCLLFRGLFIGFLVSSFLFSLLIL